MISWWTSSSPERLRQRAPYKNKKAIVDILKQAVKNGANRDYQRQHVDNIRNMTGKHRILD